MDKSLTFNYFETFEDDKLMFSYMGALSNHMVISSINLIEKNIKKDENFKKIRNKLSYLMIESFQNILRYGDEPQDKKFRYRKEMFIVRNIGGVIYIGSVNLIDNKKISYVDGKLQEVNHLDGEELNQLYRKILTNNEFTKAGGAGLGFIEMARKTHQKLQYDFVEIDENYSYFYLLITVKSKKAKDIDEKVKLNVDWFKNFHDNACSQDLVVMHKGNFSPVVIDPVIEIVESNIKTKAVNVQKLAFHIILEALQNLSLHSLGADDEKEAIFIIRHQNNKHLISTGNFIKQKNVDELKEQLDNIKQLSKKELKRIFEEKKHRKTYGSEEPEIGLGLLEIAIESNNQFDFSFIQTSEGVAFYTFNVEV